MQAVSAGQNVHQRSTWAVRYFIIGYGIKSDAGEILDVMHDYRCIMLRKILQNFTKIFAHKALKVAIM